ncbi:hypothetical protein IV203_025230 [Nitzschia inconspicua]|uniref:Uncharacterized protein n=1 Tax=Nitzschia inconspicua TaxID=303405 RepID=A0A9K3LK71_9STRA|nr:hypothetical protein IV203_025230 [Nitzschia inconspicua]
MFLRTPKFSKNNRSSDGTPIAVPSRSEPIKQFQYQKVAQFVSRSVHGKRSALSPLPEDTTKDVDDASFGDRVPYIMNPTNNIYVQGLPPELVPLLSAVPAEDVPIAAQSTAPVSVGTSMETCSFASTNNKDLPVHSLEPEWTHQRTSRLLLHFAKGSKQSFTILQAATPSELNASMEVVKERYGNITRQMVNTFIDMCPTCLRRPPVIKPLKGAARPIYSNNFRDRFQIDLIDMQDKPKRDDRGVICRWILVLKDHFTVESRNKMVKSLLQDIEDEEKKRKKKTNWTMLMGPLMAGINGHKYIIDGDPEDPTDYYFEAGSECGDNSEDDSEDDSERTSSREDDKSHQGDGDGQSASHAEPNPHVDIVDMENLDTDDNADMENIDTDATATAPPNGTVTAEGKLVSAKNETEIKQLEEATKGEEASPEETPPQHNAVVETFMGREFESDGFVYPMLRCEICTFHSKQVQLCVGNKAYEKKILSPEPWWDTAFIASFAAILAHDTHNPGLLYIHCQFPKSVISKKEVHPIDEERTVLSVLHGAMHYVVLELDILERTVWICDGRKYPLLTWANHITNILKRTALLDLNVEPDYGTKSDPCSQSFLKVNGKQEWTIKSDTQLRWKICVGFGTV